MAQWYMRLAQTNRVPDWLIRVVVRRSLARLMQRQRGPSLEERAANKQALIAKLRKSPIAIHTEQPNRQHYEVPFELFATVLGSRLKYSCCYWPDRDTTLDEAEDAMLRLTCHRARLEDVQRYEGPVLAEREHIVDQALAVPVLIAGELDPGAQPTFGTAVRAKLADAGAIGERWTSWRASVGVCPI